MKTYSLQTMLVVIGLFVCSVVSTAQPVALKTNLVYDALTTPNLGIEIGLGPKNTVQLFYGLNPWKFGSSDNRKYMKHWMLNPEWRYWFCHRFNGSFIGVHALGGEYDATNVKLPFGLWDELQDHRFEGWYVGGGVSYGYQWVLSRHWNFEAAIGLGAAYIDYQKFKCGTCGKREGKGHKTYVGPTKIALSLVYNIGGNSTSTAATSQLARDDRPQPTAARQAEGASATLVDGKVSVSGATLKNVGQQMVLTMSVGLDELRLRHGQTVVLRPLLRSASGTDSIRFRPLLVNSRDMHIQHRRGEQNKNYPDAIEIERRNGRQQTVSYLAQVPYESWMDSYDLAVEEDLCGCGDLVADNTTPLMHKPTKPEVWLAGLEPAPDKPAQQLHGTAYITFVVDKWDLLPTYMNNPTELRKITDTLDIMVADKNITVEKIKIHGWASPESPYEHNRMLATNRAQSLTRWVQQKYQLPSAVFAPAEATPENWQGLRAAVEQTGTDVLPHREEILAIIDDGSLQPDPKERLIKQRYRSEYDYLLKTVYPGLRRSDYEITFVVRKFNTVQECLDIYRTKPHQLSQHEFWRVAQTFTEYSDDYNRAVQTAYNIYPASEVAALNLANVALHQGDLLKAETLLSQAGQSAQAENARAALCILRGQYDEAVRHLDNAQQKGHGADQPALMQVVEHNREAVKVMTR